MEDKIQKLIEADLNHMGYDIVQVVISGEKDKKKLEIYIDRKDETKLQVGDCRKASNIISALLDVEDLIKDKYFLEVSSAGLERPLVKFEDFVRFQKKEVRIKLKQAHNNAYSYKGIINEAENNIIKLQSKNVELVFDYDNIKKANLVFTDKMFKEILNKKPMEN